jgi:intracellular sulfur oxidation DsrE/DsrF family protein
MAYVYDSLQRYHGGPPMKPALLLVLFAGLLLLVFFNLAPRMQGTSGDQPVDPPGQDVTGDELLQDQGAAPQGMVLDVSVNSLDELKVLLDRAEEIAARPQSQGEMAGVVLVLHGPEVEFFAISNYPHYKDIVDQAARLDAFDVVDVKICQSMMERLGVERDDIPAFIEQVPYGPGEVERLVREGYVYF